MLRKLAASEWSVNNINACAGDSGEILVEISSNVVNICVAGAVTSVNRLIPHPKLSPTKGRPGSDN